MSENWLGTIASLEVSLTGFMIASASFLAGHYLAEVRRLGIKKRTDSLVHLILALVTVPAFLSILDAGLVASSTLQNDVKSVLLIIVLSPMVPIFVIYAILVRF